MTASPQLFSRAFVRRMSIQYEIGCVANVTEITQVRYFRLVSSPSGERGSSRRFTRH
jgi:hypothetical protein